ncbi:hypothetical protein ACFSJ3_16600 [Corallincola platygyrae]|uniref:Uncharacterized protein n=1 Tax=Corallincola platygyrae TaxID=1193278 RepID=A0ABW4XPX5_9GAMM
MVTREEHRRKVRIKRLIGKAFISGVLATFIAFLVIDYFNSQNNDIEIVSEWYVCNLNSCDYRITIKNKRKIKKSVFVRVIAYYQKPQSEGHDTFPVVNSERIEMNLGKLETKELAGSITVPIEAHLLKFYVGSIEGI